MLQGLLHWRRGGNDKVMMIYLLQAPKFIATHDTYPIDDVAFRTYIMKQGSIFY